MFMYYINICALCVCIHEMNDRNFMGMKYRKCNYFVITMYTQKM